MRLIVVFLTSAKPGHQPSPTKKLESGLSGFDYSSGKAAIPNQDEVLLNTAHALSEGADANGDFGSHIPPLATAVSRNYDSVAALLLSCGADAEWMDNAGRNVLHYAVEHNAIAAVPVLLAAGVDPEHPDNISNLTPIGLAAVKGNKAMLEALGSKFTKKLQTNAAKTSRDYREARHHGAQPAVA